MKREEYRFPSLVLRGFVLYYNLDTYSAGQVIDQLALSWGSNQTKAARHLHFTVALANELRLRDATSPAAVNNANTSELLGGLLALGNVSFALGDIQGAVIQ